MLFRLLQNHFLLILLLLTWQFSAWGQSASNDYKYLVQWNDLTVETMKTDGINPVLATRIFLYPNIAAYEATQSGIENAHTLSSKLIGLEKIKAPTQNFSKPLAAITAYYRVMRVLNYRTAACDTLYKQQLSDFKKSITPEVLENSIVWGEKLGQHILNWADQDRYKQTKSMPRHPVQSNQLGTWVPTPPEYRPALEPHWGKLRPLIIRDFQAFTAPFTIEFSKEPGSDFYNLAKAVYDSSQILNEDQKHMALFWDDNPDLNNFSGHIPTPRRHINPTAHWMAIIGQVLRKEKLSFEKTAKIYSWAAMAFYEANLICWHDKYQYNLIRPITYIRQHIDPEWYALLVTPSFPEHASGHSACSAACAMVLTHLIDSTYSFTDSTHFHNNLGLRSFNSFNEAAEEVSWSRFYGGIHYSTAILEGMKQGERIAQHLMEQLESKEE